MDTFISIVVGVLIVMGILCGVGLGIGIYLKINRSKTNSAGQQTQQNPVTPTPTPTPAGSKAKEWKKSDHLIYPLWTFVGCVTLIIICLITKMRWTASVMSHSTTWLILLLVIASAALWPFNKKLGWVTGLIILCGLIYVARTDDGEKPFTVPTPSLPVISIPALSPPPQEVLPNQYGHRDIVAPANNQWSEEFDARGEREKLPDGTFRFTHPEYVGKYHIEWGRKDKTLTVEGMTDGDENKKFLIPGTKSFTSGDMVKFRSADSTKEVRMIIVWVKNKDVR